MAGKSFGRTSQAGRAYIGTHKAPKLGFGKHDGLKKRGVPQPPPEPFSRPEMNQGPAATASLLAR